MARASGQEVQRAGQPNGGAMMLGQAGQTVGTSILGNSLMNKAKPKPSEWAGVDFFDGV